MTSIWPKEFEQILRQFLPGLPENHDLLASANLQDLGLDSFLTVQLVIELEDVFEITLPDDRLTSDTFSSPMTIWTVISAEVSA